MVTLARVGCVPVHRSGPRTDLCCLRWWASAGGPRWSPGSCGGPRSASEGTASRRRPGSPGRRPAGTWRHWGGRRARPRAWRSSAGAALWAARGGAEGGSAHTHTHMHTNTHTEKDIEEERERERGRINNLMGLRVGEEGRRWFKGGQKCPSMLSYVCPTGELPRRLTQHVTHISRIKVGF